MATKRAVAKADTNTVPATFDASEWAGLGTETITPDDMTIPRLTILQALSPQLNKKNAAYIEGAEIGSIVDVSTGDLFPDGVLFLACYFRTDYLEWAPRSSGKGLVAVHTDPSILDQCTTDQRRNAVLPNGNYIARTSQYFGFNLSADGRRCFIPFASTQLKKARNWNTMIQSEKRVDKSGNRYTPPIFMRVYHLTTATESNAEGEWAGWVIHRGPTLEEYCIEHNTQPADMAQEAYEFHKQMASGQGRAEHPVEDEARDVEAL